MKQGLLAFQYEQEKGSMSRAERKRTSGVSTSSDYVRVMDQRLCQWLLRSGSGNLNRGISGIAA